MNNVARFLNSDFLARQGLSCIWLAAGTTVLCCGAAHAQSLLINGNFEAGNTGFSSDYSYSSGGNCCEGQYTVRGNGSSFNGSFVNPPPVTPGSVQMMVINGSTVANQRIWYATVAVRPRAAYFLTFNGCTAVGGGPAILQWQINGALIGTSLTLPNVTGQWRALTVRWTAPAGISSIVLAIRDLNTSSFPNDFYLDDLTMFSSACSLADIAGGPPDGTVGDGVVDGTDFTAFINSFSAGDVTSDPLADVAGAGTDGLLPDGTIDGADFIAFINAFAAGC